MKNKGRNLFPMELPARRNPAEAAPVTDNAEDDFTRELNRRHQSGVHISSFGDMTEVIATETEADSAGQTTLGQQM